MSKGFLLWNYRINHSNAIVEFGLRKSVKWTMAERDRNLRDTPGGIIASAAFNYAVKFFEYAAAKYRELSKCPIEIRHASLQAAIVVSTLIQQERRSPEDAKKLYANVSRGFPPSARYRCLAAIQNLSVYLLKSDRDALGPDEIPSLASLAGADDKQLANTLAVWLGGVIMDKWTLGEADKPAAAAMARSAWTSAIMIGRMLQV